METAWGALLNEAAHRLSQSGVDTARVDAEFMAAHVAEVARTRLPIVPPASAQQETRFRELVARRAGREPLQHILGTAPFRYDELAVGVGVFVPRPETELLVEWALERLKPVAAPVVVDLCAGSGAIGLAIVRECPQATVHLVEKYPEALKWLRRNMTGVPARVVEGDATAANTLAAWNGRCDAVLSNPPYVPAGTSVSPEVAADPATALFAGADGLDVIRPLIAQATRLLRPGGFLALEHDDSHGTSVPALLREAGFTEVADHRDLADRPRFATARNPCP